MKTEIKTDIRTNLIPKLEDEYESDVKTAKNIFN